MTGNGKGPLAGLTVVEMAGLGPCPLAGQLLADQGANVIVIDRRSAKPDPSDINRRGKRSIALNLKSAEANDIVLQLVERADILIEGFRPGVMEKLGLGPDQCQERNPGLVYGRMTGWGQSGPLSQTAGHDLNYLAITGVLHAIGPKDRPPVPPLNMVADYAGGTMFLLFGILSALYEKQRSGKGQVVDAAMSDAVPLLAGLMQGFKTKGMWTNAREANLLDGGAPFYRCYETSDGKYVSVGPLEPQFFAELVRLADLPESDLSSQYDPTGYGDKHQRYETLFKSKTRAEWEAVFAGSDACFAPVLDWDEAPDHPHNHSREVFYEGAGVKQASPAPRMDRTPAARPEPPSAPGAHAIDILQELGIDEKAIDRLKADGTLT